MSGSLTVTASYSILPYLFNINMNIPRAIFFSRMYAFFFFFSPFVVLLCAVRLPVPIDRTQPRLSAECSRGARTNLGWLGASRTRPGVATTTSMEEGGNY
jgi:hypothetical protein